MLEWIDRLFGPSPWIPVLLWAVTICAVVYFLASVIRRSWKPLKQFITLVDSLGTLAGFIDKTNATLASQNTALAEIKHEVLPNNGGSLRDAVDRHGAVLAEMQTKLANDNTRIIELQARDPQGRFVKKED